MCRDMLRCEFTCISSCAKDNQVVLSLMVLDRHDVMHREGLFAGERDGQEAHYSRV